MAVVPLDVTAEAGPVRPAAVRPLGLPQPPPRRARAGLLRPALAALLAGLLFTAAHFLRPAPYGDHLARVAAHPGAAAPLLRAGGGGVEAYDAEGLRWRHTREGRRALAVLPAAGHAFALWSDGLVTDTARTTGRTVRWHRAIPDAAPWLRTPGAHAGRGVLQPLGPDARMLAVVTPRRIAAYRVADGDLRWVLPARAGCAFEPATYMRRETALLVAQPCADPAVDWTERIVAVDDLGRIVPRRTPLGNELPGQGAAHEAEGERPGRPAKALAPHR
ncbi:hypothetical protein [Streptomyces sp. VRA16 Mangrove soil]|uniref:hypothetical protein n=1 Tax=Streptomyces sp. VRA16 Mangrove soil TaxID=2817434 RepID=UPI001E5405E8|nr:hypothetical protein [Streptomyces sp. VRA16 Mangrove soil]